MCSSETRTAALVTAHLNSFSQISSLMKCSVGLVISMRDAFVRPELSTSPQKTSAGL